MPAFQLAARFPVSGGTSVPGHQKAPGLEQCTQGAVELGSWVPGFFLSHQSPVHPMVARPYKAGWVLS